MAVFLASLDTTIISTALPTIAGEFNAFESFAWVGTAYIVTSTIATPLLGKLSDIYGRRLIFQFAMAVFLVGSVLCGLAQSMGQLIGFRALQGLGGGAIQALAFSILGDILPPRERGRYIGYFTIAFAGSAIMGPLIGGFIIEHWSWPWIFYINLPVVVLCLGIIVKLVGRYETATERVRIDAVGLILLVLFVGCFQLVLDLGREHDWFASTMITGLAITAFVTFGAFVIWELTDPHPVVDLRVLRHRSLWVGLIAMALGFGGMFAMIVLVPLWMQSVVGYTASEAGHAMAFVGVFAVAMAPVASKAFDRFDPRILITAGMLWLVMTSLLRTQWNTDGTFWDFALPQILQGFGMPFFFIGLMMFSLSSVPMNEVASAAGLLSFMRTVAGAAGTALSTSMWDSASREARANLAGSLNGADGAMAQMQAAGMEPEQARGVIERLVEAQAATIGSNHVFLVSAIVLFIAAWLVWLAPRPQSLPGQAAMGH